MRPLILCLALQELPLWSQSAARSQYAAGPVATAADQLGPGFLGHDIEAAIRSIENSDATRPKSEFETTAQYEARRAAARSDGRRFVFVLGGQNTPSAFLDGPAFEFDADTGIMEGTVRGRMEKLLLEEGFPERPLVRVRRVERESRKYVGSNAYGAERLVTSTVYDEYGLVLAGVGGLFEPDATSSFSGGFVSRILLPLDAPAARATKPNLRVAVVCTLDESRIYRDVDSSKPTISSPYEIHVTRKFLPVSPVEALVFDVRTGIVLARLPADPHSPDVALQRQLRARLFPLELEVAGAGSIDVRVDGGHQNYFTASDQPKVWRAKRQLELQTIVSSAVDRLTFRLNGQPYEPDWKVEWETLASHRFFKSAQAVIRPR